LRTQCWGEYLDLRGGKWQTEKFHKDELQNIHSWPKIICYSGLVCLIFEVLRSHTDARHSVGFLWTRDRSVKRSSTWQHKTFTRERHPYTGGVRNRKPGKRAAADVSLRPRDNQTFLPGINWEWSARNMKFVWE